MVKKMVTPRIIALVVLNRQCHFSTVVVDHRKAHGYEEEYSNEAWLANTQLLTLSESTHIDKRMVHTERSK